MAQILVYNHINNLMESYFRGENDPMPYSSGRTLLVREFRGVSRSSVLWTDRRAMESWNAFRSMWGTSIYVGFAFRRIWEGGHTGQSQHYAGVAIDMGQTLDPTTRERLRAAAVNSGVWAYVEPASLAPRWVHVDRRLGPSACAVGGYPPLFVGSRGVYVLVIQDALNVLGFTGSGLDGYYGFGTQNAVTRFQIAQGLTVTGNTDCATWIRATALANGIGLTPTVVRP